MMGQSVETLGKLPLASNAAPPAGFSAQRGGNSEGNSRGGDGGFGYGYGAGGSGYSTGFDDVEDQYESSGYQKTGYADDSSKKPSVAKGFDEQDEFDNVDALDWDFTPSTPQVGAAGMASRFSMGSGRGGRKSIKDRFKSFDPTLGLGTGSLTDIIPTSLPFVKKARNAPGDPRTIYLNDAVLNGHGRGGVKGTENQGKRKWQKNGVSTGKYNIVTFVPKFLFGEHILMYISVEKLTLDVQSNSANMPICSSCSLVSQAVSVHAGLLTTHSILRLQRAFNKSPTYHLPIDGRRLCH
jgi:hypothetical protein